MFKSSSEPGSLCALPCRRGAVSGRRDADYSLFSPASLPKRTSLDIPTALSAFTSVPNAYYVPFLS